MALQIENITKSFGTDVILSGVSITASDNEKIGLIGPNGAGKSTLLKIIAGDIPADEGRIFTPRGSTVGFLRQDTGLLEDKTIRGYMLSAFDESVKLEEEMRALEERMGAVADPSEHARVMKLYGEKSELFEKRGGFEINAKINTILNGMGFGEFDKDMKISKLSGGEKTKLSMARLLLENPDVLLLDEPTNHLDFKTMQWLEGYLKGYRGIVIAVSHDRYFLDFLSDAIYEIDRGRCLRYTGNYSAYLETKKQNEEIQLKHYNAQQQEIKRLEDYIAENGVRASTAKSAKSKQKAIDRMVLEEKPQTSSQSCRFAFESVLRSYNDVLNVENVSLQVPKRGILETIAENITFDLKRGDKAAIVGVNGAGKSTLLKSILGEHRWFSGDIEMGRNVKVSYYDQEQKRLSEEKTVFDCISDRFPLMGEAEIRTKLGSVLFKDDDVFKIVGSLSGGEKARLMFLIIMLEKPNFLILDEPTNHLDLPAKEALDTAISDYDGTVLFVSHDRYFLNKTADSIYELSGSGVKKYKGNYDDYIAALGGSDAAAETAPREKKGGAVNDYEAKKRLQANIRSLSRKAEDAEAKISELEAQIAETDLQLEGCGADFERAKSLFEDRQILEEKLSGTYELWNELTERLEKLKSQTQ